MLKNWKFEGYFIGIMELLFQLFSGFFSSLGFGKEFLSSIPNVDTLSWSNIDPQALLDELSELLDLDNFNSFFHRVRLCFAKLFTDAR